MAVTWKKLAFEEDCLLVIGTDIIKDTHIDWGHGAGQVGSEDIPDHDGHTIKDTFEHILNRGKAAVSTITLTGGLGISWIEHEIFDSVTKTFITIDAGSGNLTDNMHNYLKWVSGTTATISTSSSSDNEILLAAFSVYDGVINGYRETSLMSESVANNRRGMRALFPTYVISGMVAYEDTDVTNAFDVTMDASVFWKDGIERKTSVEIKSRNTAMVRHFHTGGVWDSDTNAEVDTVNYDNGTGLAAIPSNKYTKSLFILMGTKIGWIYPREYFTVEADAIAAALPTVPPGLEHAPMSTAVVLKQGAAAFPTNGDRWQDVRPGISEASFVGITNHAAMSNLGFADSGHTGFVGDSDFTQDSGILVGTGAGTFQEETGATLRTSIDVDQAGTDNSTDVTLNASATTGGMSLSDQEISNQAATNAQNGYMTSTLVGNIETNNGKDTNVSTNLSEGTSTETTVDVNSSDGDNATLVSASTSRAGLLTKAKFDEIVANTSTQHTQGTDTALGAQAENLDMNTHKIVGVVDPADDQDAATKKYVDDNKADSGINSDITSMTGLDDYGIPGVKIDNSVVSKTTTATLTVAEAGLVLVSASSAYTITLPTAVGNTGLTYHFKKIDANYNLITLDGDGTETFKYENADGVPKETYARLNTYCAEVTIVSGGANWQCINEKLGQAPVCQVHMNVDQENLANNTWTIVELNAETEDIGSNYDTVNHKFVVPVSGRYSLKGQVLWKTATIVPDKPYNIAFCSDDTRLTNVAFHASCTDDLCSIGNIEQLLPGGSNVYMKALSRAGVDTVDILGGPSSYTWFQIRLLLKD